MVTINRTDMSIILDHIRVAEAHAAGTPLTDLIADPLLPMGLRLVDGSMNNLTPGKELSGAADQVMPRLVPSTYDRAAAGDTAPFMADVNPRTGQQTSYLQTEGSVFDAGPRIISNLVADQTLNNPAAIASGLKHAGVTGQALLDITTEIYEANKRVQAAQSATLNVDEALALQAAMAEQALLDANALLVNAEALVTTRAAAKAQADAAFAQAEQAVINATSELVAMQTAGAVGEAAAALADAQTEVSNATSALNAANTVLSAARSSYDTAVAARDLKASEVQSLQTASSDAEAARFQAQAALRQARNALNAEADASQEVTNAQAVVDTATSDLQAATTAADNASAALATAEEALAALETQVQQAQANMTAAQTRVNDAEAAAAATQTALDAAREALTTATAAEDTAEQAFMSAYSNWLANTSSFQARAQFFAASSEWSQARSDLRAAENHVELRTDDDIAADQEVLDANAALVAAQSARDAVTPERDAAAQTVNQARIADTNAQNALAQADEALQQANANLALAEQNNVAYVNALEAMNAAQSAFDAALAAAQGAVQALRAAEGELATLEQSVINANATVDQRVTEVANAEARLATANQAEIDADAALAAAQAALTGIEPAVAAVDAAVSAAMVAENAALAAATALAEAESGVTSAINAVASANMKIADLNAPGAEAAAIAAAEAEVVVAQQDLDLLLAQNGIQMDGNNVLIPDVAPDEGLSAPYNTWMTLFGQFFDHGLDLISKGDSGTVFIPLQPDDPLYVEGSPTNFMVLSRTTNQPGPDGVLGTADDIREHANKTTPWVDQNQTYSSHPSHQVFLRDYTTNDAGAPVSSGYLIKGASGGMATWGDVKAQARDLLGINLADSDVLDGPLLATDEYGNFIPGPNGFPQLVVPNPDFGVVDGAPEHLLIEGNPDAPVDTSSALRNGHAFLEDIASTATPKGFVDHDRNPATAPVEVTADADDVTGNPIIPNQFGIATEYDNELLDRHWIAGDGRANENFGLTAVHHMFHSEHNRQIDAMKEMLINSARNVAGDVDFLNEWLLDPIAEEDLAGITAADLNWNGERMFQAAKFSTEMQYQHLAFEEFGRRVQPPIAGFIANSSAEIDGDVFAEFAHVVYRFGHSMLTENVNTISADMTEVTQNDLISAFLNPVAFDNDGALTSDQAAAAIVRGVSRETGANIDEFVTSALRDNLLGIPLDLVTLNITRGRDTGVPTLNEAREMFYGATGSQFLEPYGSWADYAHNLKTPASIINFIASYGEHETILNATTVDAKRDAATSLVLGGAGAPADRLDFLHGTGAWAGVESGINNVEFWIGGLAEAIMPFGGMLGSTFGFVFQHQMENLQNGDRFYYLGRTAGMNLLAELENNAFAEIIVRNSSLHEDGTHIGADIFSAYNYMLEVDQTKQLDPDPVNDEVDPFLGAMGTTLVQRATATADNPIVDGAREYDNYLAFNGGDHAVLGGTEQRDMLVGGLGDDSLWGDGGDDLLIGGAGVNTIRGGAGDDIIKDGDDVSFLHGDEGNDVISAGGGAAELLFGGAGRDVILHGADDAKESFLMDGDDFALGGAGADIVFGGEGDDWMEGGDGFDILMGDLGDPAGGSRAIGHDVLWAGPNDNDAFGESGDDIMFQSDGVNTNEGELGFDWVAFKGANLGGNVDLTRMVFNDVALDVLEDRYNLVEAASGWVNDDRLLGDDRIGGDLPAGVIPLNNVTTLFGNELSQEGVDRIDGLRELLGPLMGEDAEDGFDGGNILLGGGGSDTFRGRGGDDVIDGDRWLNARISIRDADDPTLEIGTVDSLQEIIPQLLDGTINPAQLQIVREILDGGQEGDIDVAEFMDIRANYDIEANTDGSYTVTHVNLGNIANLDLDPDNQNPVTLNGEGSDRLYNIEVLRFADQEIRLTPMGAQNTPAAISVIQGTAADDNIQGNPGPDVIFADIGNDTIAGAGGDDTVFAEGGNDTIVWNVGDGNDVVNGGLGGVDTFVVNGDGLDEVFRVYSAAAWTGTPPSPGTEIVVTRDIGVGETVIAQLANIQEIQINTGAGNDDVQIIGDFNPTTLNFNTITVAGEDGGDNVDISLLESAHRIVFRAQGEDTVIGAVRAQDVIVLPAGSDIDAFVRTDENGVATLTDGNRTIRFTASPDVSPALVVAGTLEAQALIEAGTVDEETGEFRLPEGAVALILDEAPAGAEAAAGEETAAVEAEATEAEEEEAAEEELVVAEDEAAAEEAAVEAEAAEVEEETAPVAPAPAATPIAPVATAEVIESERALGTAGEDALETGAGDDVLAGLGGDDALVAGAGDDALDGGAGSDMLHAGEGDDVVFGGVGNDNIIAGDGNDMVFGGEGDDRILAEDGNDLIEAGAGADTVLAGAGDDHVVATANDGNDTYDAGEGMDTLDMSAILSDVTVKLAGDGGRGMAISADSGTDTLFGFENVTTGYGNDTIEASSEVNVMDGGEGEDTFVFNTTEAANGDTILNFAPGDRIDLSGIDAVSGMGGDQAFTIVGDGEVSGPGQLAVTHETREDGDYTVISGYTSGADEADFEFSVKGNHQLTDTDFNL